MSFFIKTAQPKTSIQVDETLFATILSTGWCAQTKIHGHRAQIHHTADKTQRPFVYNRHAQQHARLLDQELEDELRRILPLQAGWTAIEGEWIKDEKRFFLFDVVKWNDVPLTRVPYKERFALLPRVYASKWIDTLPLLHTLTDCRSVLADPNPYIEGLVFKSLHALGFRNSTMIRCRRN